MKAWFWVIGLGWAATVWSQSDPATNAPAPPATKIMAGVTNEPPAAVTTNVLVAPPTARLVLQATDGTEIRWADFTNRPVLLLFWATWDEPSRKQIAALQSLLQSAGSNDLAVVGVALDDNARIVNQFVRDQQLPFPSTLVTVKLLAEYGGLAAIPTMVLLDRFHMQFRRYIGVTEAATLALDLQALPIPAPNP